MNNENNPFPPSKTRLIAAAKAGHFVHPRFFTSGLVLLSFAWIFTVGITPLAKVLSNYIKSSLSRAVFTRSFNFVESTEMMTSTVSTYLVLMFFPLSVAILSSLVPALVAKSGSGITDSKIPKPKSFSFSLFVLQLFSAAILVSVSILVLKNTTSNFISAFPIEFSSVTIILKSINLMVFACGIIFVLLGIIEMSIQKINIMTSLRVSTSEQARENRQTGNENPVKNRFRSFLSSGNTNE